MKNKILATLALTVVLASCSGTKKTTSNNTKDNTVVSVEKENTQNSETTSQVPETSTLPNIAVQASGSTGAMSNSMAKLKGKSIDKEANQMYTALEMSEEQITTYNSAMNQFKTRQANMPSGEMLGSIESERTRQLESILSSAQFAKYEKWQADN
ncbi:hypothetical protein LCGC14_0299310 [marine sediment metagenome]|uniref:Lipoprotein n=1 Tax=marine sediment metagenome TaxID=412755 RepID=A0A0F9WC54_9ZZZZ|nr:hypothetical protein [Maribacter sp.]HDZ04933.1 hypothetical protein [Maribacter sp.]HEA78853.1 hypothetical protein [Maribacter sp.]